MVQEKTDAKLDGEFLRPQYRRGDLVAFYRPRCRAPLALRREPSAAAAFCVTGLSQRGAV